MRVSDYIARRLQFLGIEYAFMVTGGAAMHLNDAISSVFQEKLIFLHHEQSCSMAADSFARITNKPCLVNVTAGPGVINALNGVFGAYVDSLPMFVVSGQSKRATLVTNSGIDDLRQLGDQEVDVQSLASSVCKSVHLLQNPLEVRELVDTLFNLSITGRPGPVWIDLPIDVQSFDLPPEYDSYVSEHSLCSSLVNISDDFDLQLDELALHLLTNDRPVLYVGNGIRISDSYNEFLDFLQQWPIACVTGWNSNDLLWDSHPCYCGRPGTVGNRSGNFAVHYSTSLLVVGCRLNIRQVSYNWSDFSPYSWKCHVDIDRAELDKPTLSTDLKINTQISGFFPRLSKALTRVSIRNHINTSRVLSHWSSWSSWLKSTLDNYPVLMDALPPRDHYVNPYRLLHKLSDYLPNNSVTVCSDGTACVAGFQALVIKPSQRLFHNSGCASMGFELPAAIGAYYASNSPITCIAGDGSIMMNIQELAIIGGRQLPIKIILLNNNGYHSIRQTQFNYFPNNIVGCGPDSGLPFPDFSVLTQSFGLQYSCLREEELIDNSLSSLYLTPGPELLEVFLDTQQQFSPKLSSKRLPSGEMVSSSLDDMSPHLSDSTLSSLKQAAFSIHL